MTSTMTRVAAADIARGDTSKHVKFTFGMVLGVEDFTQEHAYLSGRDRWLARDLIGYGTAWGLSVAIERPAQGGPRVNVDRGVGVTPLGELVCVPSMQCAYLEPWLVKHATEVARIVPDGGTVPVYVVLCYRSRETDDVPIPGEPCRSEDELSAASRYQDDFELELRLTPPAQVEETAIREFVALLRQVEIVAGPATDTGEFVERLREATLPGAAGSPPAGSPPAGSPPAGAFPGWVGPAPQVPDEGLTDHLRAAFRLWVTEIRPQVRLDIGCGADECPPDEADGCLLLAEIGLPVSVEGQPSRWFLRPDLAIEEIEVIENDRPYLLHERMLQEWMLGGRFDVAPPGGGSPPTGTGSPPTGTGSPPEPTPGTGTGAPPGQAFIVAAGRVDDAAAGLLTWSWGAPTVTMFDGPAYHIEFAGFVRQHQYVVKGTPIRPVDSRPRVFEVLSDEVAKELAGADEPLDKGIFVRLVTIDGEPDKGPFMFEISDYPVGQ